MNKKKFYCIVIVVIGLISACYFAYYYRATSLPEKILNYTFNIENVGDMKIALSKTKDLMTEECWEGYGLNNEDFTYYNFVKLHNVRTRVKILSTFEYISSGCIIFSLDNENVAKNRIFIMVYELKGLKMSKLNFYELAGKM